MQGWFNSAGEYTGRYLTEAKFKEYARTVAAASSTQGVTKVGTGYTSTELSVGKTAYDALRTTSTAAGTVVAVQQARGAQLSLMGQVKSWGTLKTLGSIGLAATSFEVGWKIGSKVADLFGFGQEGTGGAPAGGTYTRVGVKLEPILAGEALYSGGTPIDPQFELAPSDGWQVVLGEPGTFINQSLVVEPERAANTEGCESLSYDDIPTTAQFIYQGKTTSNCGGKTYEIEKGVYFVPIEVSKLPPSGVETPSPPNPIATKTTSEPTPLPASEAVPKVEACLKSPACHAVGGHYVHAIPAIATAVEVEPGYAADATIPDPAKITVPSPAVGETYLVYIDRLTELGLIGQAQELTETAIDTSKGPLEVTSTNPAVGTQVAPDTPIKVRYNPANAPEAGGGPAPSDCEANVDAVDLAPLSVPAGEKFPFGIFVFFVDWVGTWSTTVVAPVFHFPLAGSLVIHVDLAVMEPLMGPVRLAIIFASFVGLLWFLGTAALKLQGDNS